mmetsp:Transcript_4356/g.15087  ORF Transcript_4356/g.15087 Transcript_4356/m.15087 type:complete len:337 (-) Transcript_4356:68-1078(-)
MFAEDSLESSKVHFGTSSSVFLERYELGDTIGVGGFAVVKKGLDKKLQMPVAIKVVDRSRYTPTDQSLQREVEVLTSVDHPNCIKLYACYVTSKKVFIVTELVTGGELLDRVTEQGNYTEAVAAKIFRQIICGVEYLHEHGIVHRDLKLENFILENDSPDATIKIADFGLSKYFNDGSMLKTMCGSPQYVAPEVLDVGSTALAYTPAVDMWSMGVILYILLSGYSPFDDEDDSVLFDNIRNGDYRLDDPVWDEISAEAKDLLALLLCLNPDKRLSATETLAHPWLERELREGGGAGLDAQRRNLETIISKRDSLRESSRHSVEEEVEGGLGASPRK